MSLDSEVIYRVNSVIRLDFRRYLESGLRSSPWANFPEQRLVIEPIA